MKKTLITLFSLLLISQAKAQEPDNFNFNGYPVTRNVIEAYLSRMATMNVLIPNDLNVASPTANVTLLQSNDRIQKELDAIRLIKPKYIHRAAQEADYKHIRHYNTFKNAKWIADEIHNIDPDIILEAGLFESLDGGGTGDLVSDLADSVLYPNEKYILKFWPELSNQPVAISCYDMLYYETQYNITNGNIPTSNADGGYIPDLK